jgi:uncharacterized protein (TIGR03437 family)
MSVRKMRNRLSAHVGKLALGLSFITIALGLSEAQTITSLSPPSISASYPFPTLSLQVNGSGFATGAVVEWNGSSLATTFISATQLTASVPSTLYQSPGTATVTVVSGGTMSNSGTFTIGPPAPSITSTTPAYAIAGGPGFTLTINGSGFVPGSTVNFGNATLGNNVPAVTFVSSTQLTVFVPASAIAAAGILFVDVSGAENAGVGMFMLTIYPAGVNISSLDPPSIAAGYPFPTLQMTVNGSGFANGAMVEWNGSPLPTTFVSFTKLTASVPTAFLASPGTATVTVVSGGTTSNSATFTIGPPPPAIISTVPASATAGGAGFTLTLNGTGFVPQSTVSFGCGDTPTTLTSTFVSTTQLTAFVPASLIASPGICTLTADNPQSIGGGTSNLYPYTVNPAAKLSILTTSPLPSGTVDVPYSLALSATGGVPPYKNWTVTSGSLPPGMSLVSPSDLIPGLLTGVPTAAGAFTFTAQVSDSMNATASSTLSLTIVQVPVFSANGILNAASYAAGGVAPGEMITIFGSGLGPATLAPMQTDARGYVSTSLGGTQVLFDGTPAPLIYSLAGQVSAIVPYETFGKNSTEVQVVYQGQPSSTVSVPVVTAVPGVFTLDSSGSGPGAIVNQDGTVNTATNPASAGSIVMIFATGEGQTNPDGVDGKPDGFPAPTPIAQPVTATIGGVNAEVQYAGGVTGLVAGFLQVNVRIPSSVAASSAVPVIFSIAGQSSQANVTLAVGPPSAQ